MDITIMNDNDSDATITISWGSSYWIKQCNPVNYPKSYQPQHDWLMIDKNNNDTYVSLNEGSYSDINRVGTLTLNSGAHIYKIKATSANLPVGTYKAYITFRSYDSSGTKVPNTPVCVEVTLSVAPSCGVGGGGGGGC